MKSSRVTSPVLRVGLMLMCALWTVSGWYFVATQSFSTKPIRSTVVTTVNGPGAVFAGAIFVVLGLVALAILLQGKGTQKATQFWLVGLLFAIPAAVVFVRWTALSPQ